MIPIASKRKTWTTVRRTLRRVCVGHLAQIHATGVGSHVIGSGALLPYAANSSSQRIIE